MANRHLPLHTGLLEGINNKIEVTKRIAYSLRHDDYFFFLKSAPPSPEFGEEVQIWHSALDMRASLAILLST